MGAFKTAGLYPADKFGRKTARVVASSAPIRENREVFSMARRAQVCITHQGHFQHLL
jgi:hypothetical protein